MRDDLMMEIVEYCLKRKYVFPNAWQAMGWVNTEIGEVYELLLAREADWVRNNPDSKAPYSRIQMAEELGDIIFMVMLAGYAQGVNPMDAMIAKMARKLSEASRTMTGVSRVIPVTDEEAERIFNEIADQEEERGED